MSIQEGTYFIVSKKLYDGYRLSLDGEDRRVVLLHPSEGAPEWKVSRCSNGNYVIKNTKFERLYLVPEYRSPLACLAGKREAFEWRIQQSVEKGRFYIVAPGGPIDGTELAVDLVPTKVYPAWTAIRPLQVDNAQQAWLLVKKND